MARDSKKTPETWKTLGVWYVVDVGDDQTNWREYSALREKDKLTPQDTRRLDELEPLVADLFEVRILPYSGEEFDKLETASRKGLLSMKADGKGTLSMRADPITVSEQLMLDVCRERILDVRGFNRLDAVLDEATGEAKDWIRAPITTGKALVDFVRKEAWEEEESTLKDIYRAIREISHLEKGQKKTFSSRSSSSAVATSP